MTTNNWAPFAKSESANTTKSSTGVGSSIFESKLKKPASPICRTVNQWRPFHKGMYLRVVILNMKPKIFEKFKQAAERRESNQLSVKFLVSSAAIKTLTS